MRLLLPSTEKVPHVHSGRRRAARLTSLLARAFRLRGKSSHAAAGHGRADGGGRRVAMLVGALMVGTLCVGDRGLIKLIGLLRDRSAVHSELVRLELHRAALAKTLRLYTTDSATIEKTARESLDWVRRGETVYKFPSK